MPESFGRAAVEPQVMGRPVIASDHGGVTETVVDGETGWLVAVGRSPTPGPRPWPAPSTSAPRKRLEMGEIGRNRARDSSIRSTPCAPPRLAAYERVLEARA